MLEICVEREEKRQDTIPQQGAPHWLIFPAQLLLVDKAKIGSGNEIYATYFTLFSP